ncbi:MAG TPA: haloacid dehalogenase, partial [Devosia sp.]|nr:haloacid dehalogenase [Devosia sp.]
MTRAVFFDVDGVLIDGMHARPERSRRWDATLLADMGVDPERFTQEFIFDVFVKKVSIGQMSVIDALERYLPSLGYKGSAMVFHH